MDVGVGVSSKQGLSMPSMQISGRGLGLCFASTHTFRMHMSLKCSTRNWSSPLQQHRLMAGRTEIAQKSHPLMVSKSSSVLNNPPLMVGEAKIASNDYIVMATDAQTSSDCYPFIARKSKIQSNHHPVMAREVRTTSNCFPPMVGEVKFDANTCPLIAKGGIISHRKSLMAHAVKVASNGKEIGVRNAYKQSSYQQVRHMHDNHRPARVSEEKCISVSEGRCFETMVSSRGHTHSKGLGVGVVEQNYSQQPNSMSSGRVVGQNYTELPNSMNSRWVVGQNYPQLPNSMDSRRVVGQNYPQLPNTKNSRWVVRRNYSQHPNSNRSRYEGGQNSSQQSNSMNSRFQNGRRSWNTPRMEDRNMSPNAVIPCSLYRRNEGQELLTVPREPRTGKKSDENMEGCGDWKEATQSLRRRRASETESKFILIGDVPSLEKQPESIDISVEKQEHEDQAPGKYGLIGSSSMHSESDRKSEYNISEDKRVGEDTDNAILASMDNNSKVSASALAAPAICGPKSVADRLKEICVVKDEKTAEWVVGKLMGVYKDLIHACDTEVAYIDVKKESPVGHGKLICFSICCGPKASFGDGKSCVWVDVLDGGEEVLSVFARYFENSSIRKVFHNYSFDRHIIENHGIHVCGFYADTMHLARLWNSARREEGGYSLESLTKDPKVMDGIGVAGQDQMNEGKLSMKTLFGKKKLKMDGSEGKTITIAPVEELQRTERDSWICYSALDSKSTWNLWKSLQRKLKDTEWTFQGNSKRTMYDFYEEYWRPFGDLLVEMESKGMLVNREYLSEMEEVAKEEQEKSASRFKSWASSYCPDAKYMNVGSGTQVRQLLFGGMRNNKNPNETLPMKRTMKVPNVDNFIVEGKKAPLKSRNIELHGLGVNMEVEQYTASGWPAVTGAALKVLAGKVSIDYEDLEEEGENDLIGNMDEDSAVMTSSGVKSGENTVENNEEDISVYGTAYSAFGGGEEGRKACHAIAALCEVHSINTLISNFLLPLQGEEISDKDGRVHCSLNINTETGRLSARNPNLQNQPALEKDRYKIRQAFIASPGNTLIVADYGQLELRILAHLSNCRSMLDAFKAGGDFHSRTAMNMYAHVRYAVEKKDVLLEWDAQPGEEKPPIPLLKDVFASERRKAKMLNFSIAYGKTAVGLSKDWKVSLMEAKETVNLWYNERKEVLKWQEERKHEARTKQCVYTLLGRARHLPCTKSASFGQKGHIERAAINTPVQGSAADVAMCAMLEISRNAKLKELGWTLVLQVHDEVILEGPAETAELAKELVVNCMSHPFYGENILKVDLAVDAKYAPNWYAAK